MPERASVSFGVDFGTTNTVVVRAERGGATAPVRLHGSVAGGATCPSVLAFEQTYDAGRTAIAAEAGAEAVRLAAAYPDDFRYLQSFKSHVASPDFDATTVFGKRFEFSHLLGNYLIEAGIADAIRSVSGPKTVTVGRPVRFHGENPDEALALERYRAGFRRAGIDDFDFALEPVGGAYSFFRHLDEPTCVLIGDFGGGTSDFAVAVFRPADGAARAEVLAHAGIGIAGDAFDRRIVDHALARHFGAETAYRLNDKVLPMPRFYLGALSNWHDLTRMRAPRHLDVLRDIARTADDPGPVAALIHAVETNQGLAISRAVAEAKAALSEAEETDLLLDTGRTSIRETISRPAFEDWIAEDLAEIAATVDRVMAEAGRAEAEIDRVFLTGGTSFVPAVQAIFAIRFGAERLRTGDRFSAVAEGLALHGLGR